MLQKIKLKNYALKYLKKSYIYDTVMLQNVNKKNMYNSNFNAFKCSRKQNMLFHSERSHLVNSSF